MARRSCAARSVDTHRVRPLETTAPANHSRHSWGIHRAIRAHREPRTSMLWAAGVRRYIESFLQGGLLRVHLDSQCARLDTHLLRQCQLMGTPCTSKDIPPSLL